MKLLQRGRADPPSAEPEGLLGQRLLAGGVITARQLQDALKRQRRDGGRLGEILVRQGAAEQAVVGAVGLQQNRTPIDLDAMTVDEDAVLSLEPEVVHRLAALPLFTDAQGRLHVATPTPENEAVADEIRTRTGKQVVLELAGANAVQRGIERHYTVLHRVGAAVERAVGDVEYTEPARVIAAVAADAPIVEIVDLLMTQALRDRASDIHLEPQKDRLRVRYRVDGVLREVQSLPRELAGALSSRLKILANMDIVDRHRAQDGQMAVEIDGHTVDVRVATMETVWGEKVALRLLDPTRVLVHITQLGLVDQDLTTIRRLTSAPFGLLVVSGPTGSGKTTSLYAVLNELDRERTNITTIEDPVEYQFENINQIQINRLAGTTFANGLRAILRQDPDVVLVGEVRDAETASIAVQAALTGHLVLCSLHASDAVGALYRFLDMGVEPYLLSSAMIGVIAQRLVRLSCTHCAAPAEVKPEEAAFYRDVMGSEPEFAQLAGPGCKRCGGTGFRERIGVFECLAVNDELRRQIVGHAPITEIQTSVRRGGLRTLQMAGCGLAENGRTTLSEVMRSVYTI